MLTARQTSVWGNRWTVTRDEATVTTVEASGWRGHLRFELDGRHYTVAMRGFRPRTVLREGDAVVAEAEGVGGKHWSVTHEEHTYAARRVSFWRGDQEVRDADGAVLGGVRRANAWYTAAETDLEGVPDVLAVFVLAAVLLSWSLTAAGAAVSASG